MLRLLKRYRDPLVLGALLLYPFATFLASGHKGRNPNFVDRAVLAIASPLERGLTYVCDGVGALVSGYLDLRRVKQRNRALEVENAELRAELNASREGMAELERVKRMLGYVEGTLEQEIPARIVGVNPTPNFLSVRINRGESDGVRAGMPVVTPDGVVGRVQRSVGGWSDVALVTDPTSKLGVLVQRTRARGTSAGAGGAKPLALENVLRSEEVEEGDVIITSGTDDVFPKGLVVGRVTAVQRQKTGMFLQAGILPSVELARLEEVLVVPSAPSARAIKEERR
ncbi:MAG: rod shape-determining protein MreC [Myxococcales bacterium]|nr:rod shape-determining protein MreC [Myxococcales bacterium]